MPAHGDLALAHGFEQRGLHLGRGAVDFVGKQDGMEDRAGHELEPPFLRAPDFGTGQVGRQQVRGELHAREIRIQPGGQSTDRGGLGQSRGAFDQQVAIRQQCGQQALDERALADDFGRQTIAQRAEGIVQAVVLHRSGRGGIGHGGRQIHGIHVTSTVGRGSIAMMAGQRRLRHQDWLNAERAARGGPFVTA